MSNKDCTLTQKEIKELLDYSPSTGQFRWRVGRRGTACVGSNAGYLCGHGYIEIRVFGKRYYAHRLAWLYVYGHFPDKYIDHINRQKSDNRIVNLRDVSQAKNCANRSKKVNGFSLANRNKYKKYRARIKVNGIEKHIGYFLSANEAIVAYENFKKENDLN